MPLHSDDPARPGNLTDDEYTARARQLRDEQGDDGLHTIPADVLAAAEERAARNG